MKDQQCWRRALAAVAVLMGEHLDAGLGLEHPLARRKPRIVARNGPVAADDGLRVTTAQKRLVRTVRECHAEDGRSFSLGRRQEEGSLRYFSRIRFRF